MDAIVGQAEAHEDGVDAEACLNQATTGMLPPSRLEDGGFAEGEFHGLAGGGHGGESMGVMAGGEPVEAVGGVRSVTPGVRFGGGRRERRRFCRRLDWGRGGR